VVNVPFVDLKRATARVKWNSGVNPLLNKALGNVQLKGFSTLPWGCEDFNIVKFLLGRFTTLVATPNH
jgi:hypothetical protein